MLSRRFLRIKVIKSLYSHFKSGSESLAVSEKNLIYSVNKAYDLYFQMLSLVVDIARYAEERIEIGLKKKLPTEQDLNPNYKFVENLVVAQIADSDKLNDTLQKRRLGWSQHPQLIRHLYNEMVESDYYKAYMEKPSGNYVADLEFVKDFYINTAQDDQILTDTLEEVSIMWCDDLDFSLIMVLRTLDNCRAKQTDISLLPQFKNDDDIKFFKRLFAESAVRYSENLKYIEKFTENWDIERIAYMDNLIMTTAMTELIVFESIPIKVTFDEYIEISKYYSTPGSSLFINGILDKVTNALKADGTITKSGRGLL